VNAGTTVTRTSPSRLGPARQRRPSSSQPGSTSAQTPRHELQRSDAPASGPGARSSTGHVRVLVVDDEASIRLLCRVNLREAGMEVLEAGDGAAGLRLARAEHPDLILLDVMLPGPSGWEIAKELAADPATADIPIVFLTARADRADRAQGRALGGVGYVVKPFDPVALPALVEQVLDRLANGERELLCRELADDY
jgi:CheY-like chemotaxis protein